MLTLDCLGRELNLMKPGATCETDDLTVLYIVFMIIRRYYIELQIPDFVAGQEVEASVASKVQVVCAS